MKKIAVGDLGEFWYGDYKEPFEQLEGGVPGHPVGVVLKADDGRLLCAYCGGTYKHLGLHAAKTHRMRANEYKDNVGLLHKSALVSEDVRFRRIAVALRGQAAGTLVSGDIARNRLARGRTAGNHLHKAEALNKTGRCYSQIIAVARELARTGTLSLPQLRKRGIGGKIVAHWFGDIAGLRKIVGARQPPTGLNHRMTNAQLLAGLRAVGMAEGRPPFASDLARHGLPSSSTYVKRFGSYSAACAAAGLPNRRLPLTGDAEVRLLVAYATIGDMSRAATAAGHSPQTLRKVLSRYGYPFPPQYRGSGRREWATEMADRLAGTDIAA